ncbi:hypothetical protein [Lactobacillus helveticus]|uniref:hypothetical protein n=1 Tax=Lactobacillus helveticus TaxID=1587 RepID=UPI0015640FCC|nr:hypothetical protein [Lactobacillus helveticus]NRN92694.1 hypothetical protein [Lactobacillus helveticus]
MSAYIEGKKFLDENDLPPQWNLLSGTSEKYKTVTIPKGAYYPGNYEFFNNFNFPVTFSAFVINNSDTDIRAHMDDFGNGTESNVIKAGSQGKVIVNNFFTQGCYFETLDKLAANSNINLQVKEEKLEPGAVATAWLPAISDLALKSDLGK